MITIYTIHAFLHFVKPLLKKFQENFSKEPLMEFGHIDFSAKITPTDEKNATGQKMERNVGHD